MFGDYRRFEIYEKVTKKGFELRKVFVPVEGLVVQRKDIVADARVKKT